MATLAGRTVVAVSDASPWMIDGLAIAGYRSFGAEPQRFGPLGKMAQIGRAHV